MYKVSKNTTDDATSEPNVHKLPPDEQVAGRARVAQLLGQLIFKRWQQERQHNKEQMSEIDIAVSRESNG